MTGRAHRQLDGSLLLWLLCGLALGCTPLVNMDFWWHLRTGQLILERGEVPATDWFTYTSTERAWIDLHWGFQVLVTWLYRIGGTWVISLAKGLALTTALALGWMAAGGRLSTTTRVALWLLPLVSASSRVFARPEILTMVFLAAWILILGRAGSNPRWLWLLPVVQAAWTNSHGLFVLGPMVGAAWLVDRMVRSTALGRRFDAPAGDLPSSRQIVIVAVLVGVACLATPYGVEGLLVPWTLFRKLSVDRLTYSSSILEFRPTLAVFRAAGWNGEALSLAGVVALTGASFAPSALKGRLSLFRLLLFVAFGYLAANMIRNVNLFALVSGVVLVGNFEAWRAPEASPSPPTDGTRRPGVARLALVLVLSLLFLSVVTGRFHRWIERPGHFGFGAPAGWYAHQAARFAGQPGMPETAFVASFGHASTYLFHNSPQRRVFLDGRLEVASIETFHRYLEVKRLMRQSDRRWEELVKDGQGRLPAVILDVRSAPKTIRAVAATAGWRPVFRGPAAVVFLEEAVAERLGLPALTGPRPGGEAPASLHGPGGE